MISAFEELQVRGHFGPVGVALTQKLAREELARMPVLAGHELDDVVQGFFVDRLPSVTAMLMAQARDEASFGRLLRKSIRHWLIDQARKTGGGALRRSIEKILKDDAFEQVSDDEPGAGRWRLAGTDGAPFGGDLEPLVKAARGVSDVRVPKWTSDSRRPPLADHASLVAITRAVLTKAEGSLELAQLVFVFTQRFPAALDPIVVSAADVAETAELPSPEPTAEDLVIAADTELDTGCAAVAVHARLSADERTIVPVLDDVAAVRERLGLGRSRAYQMIERTRTKLVELAGTGPNAQRIVLEVIELCR
ncbi:hypothetical protein [Actinokineospora sp. UTMC 2448]|uniref:hypothetical protein n=1 Tax=Actinokineospora sp. UTMC 2448 TaxID=2268449 RepID=UPI0021645C6D|nr:hypothetical protein [Actinokineospora sp. UTMC 2448]UVS80552.1 hypothetical protein Actkin_04303 [Actinokineospora sp. UTMC 2448]